MVEEVCYNPNCIVLNQYIAYYLHSLQVTAVMPVVVLVHSLVLPVGTTALSVDKNVVIPKWKR